MIKRTYSNDWEDYELIDAGNEKKLERWGDIITIRPERLAYFTPSLPYSEWEKQAHLQFVPKGKTSGEWKVLRKLPSESWNVRYKNLTFKIEPTKFKHVGLFPEQAVNWNFIHQFLDKGKSMLNLFAYTGAASVVGKATGAQVTHVDAVKQLIGWAKTNMELSELEDIRWIHEDAVKFAQRELKRNNFYDLIVMDPPAWGIGAKNEKWKIETELEGLIEVASQLLNQNGVLILNTYSPRVDLNTIETYGRSYFTKVETSELWKKTSTKKELFYGHLLRAWK